MNLMYMKRYYSNVNKQKYKNSKKTKFLFAFINIYGSNIFEMNQDLKKKMNCENCLLLFRYRIFIRLYHISSLIYLIVIN